MRIAAAFAALLLVSTACAATPGPPDLARPQAGPVRGLVTEHQRQFLGIPYAAKPVRWQAPRPATPWTETRDATKPGSLCPQEGTEYAEVSSTDEDCLFLNVTAPKTGDGKPVLVWIHGDGVVGGGNLFDPAALVRTGDVVVVTVNYRLGVFGAFGYPGLAGSGTFGLQDQQAALRWVRDNITAFGGDPGNVTLIGESYGAQSVSAHLLAPASAGLFHKAVMQSPMTLLDMPAGALMPGLEAGPWLAWRSAEEVTGVGAAMAAQFGCADPATAVDCLRALPVEQLFPLMRIFQAAAYGNEVLPDAPDSAYGQGKFHQVPVLLGTTRDEHRAFVGLFYDLAGQPVTAGQYPQLLRTAFGDQAERIAAEYPLSAYPSPSVAWADVLTDRMWARGTSRLAELIGARNPLYTYEFADREAPSYLPFPDTFPTGAYHAAEVPYLFRDAGFEQDSTQPQKDLSDAMIRYWTGFARAGAPAADGLPPWPRGQVQSLAPGPDGIRPVDFAAEHRLDFWAGVAG
ncbi:carboxylesterase/lipase family protein [Amycolatopsis magusensis]|uniref:carboxylesterase/lipase family protein n=1 Tax=Amycolatopsis magusensis TaxID=882444 RepID=UPI003C2F7595